MTIFDVIRFPNPDIYSKDINKLPRDLLEKWVIKCANSMGHSTINVKNIIDFSGIINYLISSSSFDTYRSIYSQETIENIHKKEATAELKKMIAEYDQEF